MDSAAVRAPIIPDLTAFMLEISDTVTDTLDLDQVLGRVAEIVRRVVDYHIFAILLVNDKTQEMRVRFAVGHLPEVVDNIRVKIGAGITGAAAATGQPQFASDVSKDARYINALDGVKSELAVPIIWKRRCIGVIDLQARELGAFTEEHLKLVTVVASRIANAIENARLYRNAITRERTLELLNDISREMTSILALDDLLRRTAEMVKRVIDYQVFSVLLLDQAREKLEHRVSVQFGKNVNQKLSIAMDKGIVGAAATSGKPVIVRDVREDPRYISLQGDVRSELAVPLIYKEEVIGVLDLEHTKKGYFNEGHARTITTLAAQMAVAIGNARLYEQVLRAERQMQRDLHLAQTIQRHLLPECCPTLPSLEVWARTVPARQLGGDLFDFMPYKSQRYAFAVGDVSGKGAGAALYGAVVSGILRTQAAHQPGPAEMLSNVNSALLQRKIDAQFMTLIYAVWNERSRKLLVANSGLPFPVHSSSDGCHVIKAAGIPLGMLEDAGYDELTVTLRPGDIVAFVSDGITEQMNAAGEEYGRIRLETVIRNHRERGAKALVEAIFVDVERFAGTIAAADDRTVVVLKAKG